jgi:dTDP-4-dehydrorhamnose 3,5-epimerase
VLFENTSIQNQLFPSSPRSMRITESVMPGCCLVEFAAFRDHRGLFVKSFRRADFEERGMECDFVESFYTESGEDVLRGMHFQLPPVDHAKLVYCISGSILDMALDLRVGSPTYGECEAFELSAEAHNAVYLPRGIAHGFLVRSAPAVVAYQVTSEHSPAHDTGIRWDSFGAAWPRSSPVISKRDQALMPLEEFQSPFRFEEVPAYETIER